MSNLYDLLEVSPDATTDQIKESYKRLAKKWHPDKHPNDAAAAGEKFGKIASAYEILGDEERRKDYDLTREVPFMNLQAQQRRSPDDIMRNFFNDVSGMNWGKPPHGDTQIIKFFCTLEELYTGNVRRVKLTTRNYNPDGTSTPNSRILTLNIKRGWKSGTKITFPQEGDRRPNMIPGDIVFQLVEKQHDIFVRDNSNLRCRLHIPLKQALLGGVMNVKTLDNRNLEIPFDGPIEHGTIKKIPSEGMPLQNIDSKGDLYIECNVVFPKFLSAESRELLKIAL